VRTQQLRELEVEVSRLLTPQLPTTRAWHWTREGYAQGLLLHLLEDLGFQAYFLPALDCGAAQDGRDIVSGCRMVAAGDGRSFSAYDQDLGVAVVKAAIMALRSRPQAGSARAAS
jgi:hypothetical protein